MIGQLKIFQSFSVILLPAVPLSSDYPGVRSDFYLGPRCLRKVLSPVSKPEFSELKNGLKTSDIVNCLLEF